MRNTRRSIKNNISSMARQQRRKKRNNHLKVLWRHRAYVLLRLDSVD
ncbi:hypothetical protein L0B53_04920 [Vibrio sp. SS-MA-C1-2]|nr:hypothetical protein [Vibrio sp. SS-MA-C1-2]UJF18949.1 hypothetical protein L0B53_04920 [Vibrio sp. SS-MA-C1-2]